MFIKIGELARTAKVSIRTLRHYDEIGLLSPVERSESGYRLYSHKDAEKLQQILFYRSLQFPLDKIQMLMNDPAFDRETALLEQRDLLVIKAGELSSLLALIDTTIQSLNEDKPMDTSAMFEAFPDTTQEILDEAENLWGDSPQYGQSQRRYAHYSRQDWLDMKTEMNTCQSNLERLFEANVAPDTPEALAGIEEARLIIEKWHYDCPKAFHVSLTAMTSQDERFVKNIDRNCSGLAAWMHEAARANANPDRQRGSD